MTLRNRLWRLVRHPGGLVTPEDFAAEEAAVGTPGEGEILVRVRMVSLDPALRLYMDYTATGFHPHIQPGDVMFGFAIGEIVESRAEALAPGDLVTGRFGWQHYAIVPGADVFKRNPAYPLTDALGVLGITGMTAYHGILNQGAIQAGETAIISAAAGAVGSIAGQIAKIRGARVIGIVGSQQKADWIQSELGFDGAANYREGSLVEQLAQLCPGGADLYFDNVGGPVLGAAIPNIRPHGRVVFCGFLSYYNTGDLGFNFTDFMIGIIVRELKLTGLNVDRFMRAHMAEAEADMAGWISEGRLKAQTEIRHGFENLPTALSALFAGENTGKLVVEF